jgi:hypothetical protein
MFSGISIFSFLQPPNIARDKLESDFGILTYSKFIHDSNASSPIYLTVSGKSTVFNEVQF